MRVFTNAVLTHKKPNAQKLKQRKAEMKSRKSKKKDQNAPKRPATAFFVFMEEFRKTFKDQFPDAKAGPVVGKAGGGKWKSMSDAEKAPYAEKALKRKAEYEIALEAYKNNLNCYVVPEPEIEIPAESQKSTSEVHDDTEQEASSSSQDLSVH